MLSATNTTSTSTVTTAKSIDKTVKTRAHTKLNQIVTMNEKWPSSSVSLSAQPDNASHCSTNQTKIDNLLYFPVEVLENIFAKIDDIGLLDLAETCKRFTDIAHYVFAKRYAKQHFVINGECKGGNPQLYATIFNRFGCNIKAIKINYEFIDEKSWMVKMLQQHFNQIQKISFEECMFESQDICLQPMDNITHLTFQTIDFNWTIDLPDCHKLVQLEIRDTHYFSYNSLKECIRNNPALQSIKLYQFVDYHKSIDFYRFITFIVDHLNGITELAVVDDRGQWKNPIPHATIDRIVYAFKHLESLALSVNDDTIELLQRIGMECKRIKHLELHSLDNDLVMLKAIRSFKQIESLCLAYIHIDEIESLTECLPSLRHLSLKNMPRTMKNVFAGVSSLLCKCPSLEKVTIEEHDIEPDCFINVNLYKEFIDTITTVKKPNARIEVEDDRRQIIGIVTKNEIVWRNKLLHWMGCDKNNLSSNIHLLDLADHAEGRENTEKPKQNATQRNLLDRIFDYLDVHTLSSFGGTSVRCKQFVESYIKKHLQTNKTFIINNEFNSYDHSKEFVEHMFAPYVTDLKIYNFRPSYRPNNRVSLNHFKYLTKLTIDHAMHELLSTSYKLPASVRHIVFDADFIGYWELCSIFKYHKHIETIELKKAGFQNDWWMFKSGENNALKPLKKLILKCSDENQLKILKDIFKYANTQLVLQ